MAARGRGTFACPNCGADVPRDAMACPECGSDADTGWSQDAEYDDLDLPTGYGEEEEEPANVKDGLWRVVAVGLLIIIIVLVLARMW